MMADFGLQLMLNVIFYIICRSEHASNETVGLWFSVYFQCRLLRHYRLDEISPKTARLKTFGDTSKEETRLTALLSTKFMMMFLR
jgi:hypothetical protein